MNNLPINLPQLPRIAFLGNLPRTVEQIAQDYDLPIDAVQEAIAYCESNPPEILEDWRREEALMEASGMNDPNYRYHPSPKLLTPQEIAQIRRTT